jgi:hypothetical protein
MVQLGLVINAQINLPTSHKQQVPNPDRDTRRGPRDPATTNPHDNCSFRRLVFQNRTLGKTAITGNPSRGFRWRSWLRLRALALISSSPLQAIRIRARREGFVICHRSFVCGQPGTDLGFAIDK